MASSSCMRGPQQPKKNPAMRGFFYAQSRLLPGRHAITWLEQRQKRQEQLLGQLLGQQRHRLQQVLLQAQRQEPVQQEQLLLLFCHKQPKQQQR